MAEDSSVTKKIKSWLDEQGYPLEMQVAAIAQRAGFRVIQSEYFEDPDTREFRELDVVAHVQKIVGDVVVRLSLLIECKRSTDKPWLLFTSDRVTLGGVARVAQRAGNDLGRSLLLRLALKDSVQNLPIFGIPTRSSYGVTQAFTTGKDVCYAAVTSVSKAASAFATAESDTVRRGFLDRGPRFLCSFLFPIVVVDGLLFEVYLDREGAVAVEAADKGTLLWRNRVVRMPHTIVTIGSISSFEGIVNQAYDSAGRLFNLLEGDLAGDLVTATERLGSPSLGPPQ